MFPHNLQSLLLAAVAVGAVACGSVNEPTDARRDESFLSALGGGKADALGIDITEGSVDARGVLVVANTLSYLELHALGLDRRATSNIIAHRDGDGSTPADDDAFDTLSELDATPWVGVDAFERLYDYARTTGIIEAVARPVACDADADCGASGVCHVDRCYDLDEIALPGADGGALSVARDGEWWVRLSARDSVQEVRGALDVSSVEVTDFGQADLTPWLVALPDGTLTAVTRVGDSVVPEFGPPLADRDLRRPVAAAYDADGDLLVALEIGDAQGTAQGVVVMRQTEDAWLEELKAPFESGVAAGDHPTISFTRDAQGRIELWVDIGTMATRLSRDEARMWRTSFRLDMADAGFGGRAVDRTVEFLQAEDGVVVVHRACGQFSRTQEVVRIEGDLLTSVAELPSSARAIAAHADGTSTVVLGDGSLARLDRGELRRGTVAVGAFDRFTAHGDDLYVLDGSALRVLRAR